MKDIQTNGSLQSHKNVALVYVRYEINCAYWKSVRQLNLFMPVKCMACIGQKVANLSRTSRGDSTIITFCF